MVQTPERIVAVGRAVSEVVAPGHIVAVGCSNARQPPIECERGDSSVDTIHVQELEHLVA